MKRIVFLLLISINLIYANIGKITAVKGDVIINRGTQNITAKSGFILELNDKVITQDKSKALILFNDKTSITIGKKSSLLVNEFIIDEINPANSKTNIKFGKGIFRTISGKIGKLNPKGFKIKTKTASIGIRGTVFDTAVSFTPQGAEKVDVAFLEGRGTITSDIMGITIPVNTGENAQMDISGQIQVNVGTINPTNELDTDSQTLEKQQIEPQNEPKNNEQSTNGQNNTIQKNTTTNQTTNTKNNSEQEVTLKDTQNLDTTSSSTLTENNPDQLASSEDPNNIDTFGVEPGFNNGGIPADFQNSPEFSDPNFDPNLDPTLDSGFYYDPFLDPSVDSGFYGDPSLDPTSSNSIPDGLVFDSNLGLYYDLTTGLYYDPYTGLYFNIDADLLIDNSSVQVDSPFFNDSPTQEDNTQTQEDNTLTQNEIEQINQDQQAFTTYIETITNEVARNDTYQYFSLYAGTAIDTGESMVSLLSPDVSSLTSISTLNDYITNDIQLSYSGDVYAAIYDYANSTDQLITNGSINLTIDFSSNASDSVTGTLNISDAYKFDLSNGNIYDNSFTSEVSLSSSSTYSGTNDFYGDVNGNFFGTNAEIVGGTISITNSTDDIGIEGVFGANKQ